MVFKKVGFLLLFVIGTLFYLFYPATLSEIRQGIFNALGDELLGLWIFDRLSDNLFSPGASLLDGGIFYPNTKTLAFAESMILPSLAYRAVVTVVGERVLAYHMVLILFFMANAFTMAWLVSRVMDWKAALVAALIYCLSMVRLAQYSHVQLLPQLFFPLAGYALYLFEKTQKRRYLSWAAACVAAQFYCSIHFGIMLFITLVPYVAIRLLLKKERTRFLSSVTMVGILVGILVFPLAREYYLVSREHRIVRGLGESRTYAADVGSYFSAPPGNLYGHITRSLGGANRHEKHLFVGFSVLGLFILGLRRGSTFHSKDALFWKRVGVATLIFVVWLSFGPAAGLYWVLYHLFPGLQALRVPARFGLSYLFLVALFAALGLQPLMDRFKRGFQPWVLFSLIILFLIENRVRIPIVPIPRDLEGVTRHLRNLPNHLPVAHLPLSAPPYRAPKDQGNVLANREVVRMYYGLSHRHPLFNGYAGFSPATYSHVLETEERLGPCEALLDELFQLGMHYVVIEKNILEEGVRNLWLDLIGKLCPIYEDDHVAVLLVNNRKAVEKKGVDANCSRAENP